MTKKVHNFNQSKAVGDAGEAAIQDLLDKQCYYVADVTNQEDFYEPDIDYICIDEALNSEFIELKTDTYTAKNGNLFIETVSNDSTDKKGWYYECDADWLWYYAVPSTVYIFDLEEMRKELGEEPAEYSEEAEVKEVWNKSYRSEGVTISLDRVPERLYEEKEITRKE